MAARKPYRAPRRLYLSRDKERVVEEGDPDAGFLLAAQGAEVPQAEVERYTLHELPSGPGGSGPGGGAEAEAEDASEGEARDDPKGKMVAGPPEDKAQPAPPGAAPRRAGQGGPSGKGSA